MNSAHRSRARRISLILHRWHRRFGVLVSVFVLWLAISGWLLNHTAFLNLAQRSISLPLLSAHYGLSVELPVQAFNAGAHWLTFNSTTAWLDGKSLESALSQPLGLIEGERALYLANATTLLLLEKNGAPIDSERVDSLPIKNISRLGYGCGGVVISDAQAIYASGDGISWQRCDSDVQWSSASPLSAQQRATIEPLVQPAVSLEKLIQDLHSGRFFGAWGPLFIDFVGLIFVVLALSGLWMFAHQRKQRALRR